MKNSVLAVLCTMLLAAMACPGCGGTSPEPADAGADATPEASETQLAAAPAANEVQLAPDSTQTTEAEAATEVTSAEEENGDELVARIGESDGITRKELHDAVRDALSQQNRYAQAMGQPAATDLPFEQKLAFLNRMVDAKLLDAMAEEEGIEVAPEEIDAELDQLKARFADTGADFDEALASHGLDVDSIRSQIEISQKRKKFIEEKTAGIATSDEEVQAEYDKLKEAGRLTRKGETVDVAHILVKVPKGSDEAAWEEAKKEIDAARQRVVDGEDFGAVAKEVTDDPGSKESGGLYEEVEKGRMVPEFEKAAFDTPVGEMSEPFRTDYGWHFVDVRAKHEANTDKELKSLDEMIRVNLNEKKRRERFEELIKQAREKYDVAILLEKPADAPAEAAPEATEESAPSESE